MDSSISIPNAILLWNFFLLILLVSPLPAWAFSASSTAGVSSHSSHLTEQMQASSSSSSLFPCPVRPQQQHSNKIYSPIREVLIERNATIKHVSWLGGAGEIMMPLQIYQGAAVRPKPKSEYIPTVSDATRNLSLSAQTLFQQYDNLSDQQKSQLENKIQAEARASTPLDPLTDLYILYHDQHICVTSKPSGILSVPGPRRNPSLAGLVYDLLRPDIDIDQMVVHRLDMDTSGIIVYALTEEALKTLHIDFRDRRVYKSYEALLAGHLRSASEVEIDVDLERDPFHPPFMRAAQPKAEVQATLEAVHPTFQKFIDQTPKPSQTELHVLSLEYLPGGLPVTRVRLIPQTGRTHQLRVHCASLGFPIVGDDIYGIHGAGDCGIQFTSEMEKERLKIQHLIYEQRHSLCLHAKQLCFNHPFSGAPLIFESATPF